MPRCACLSIPRAFWPTRVPAASRAAFWRQQSRRTSTHARDVQNATLQRQKRAIASSGRRNRCTTQSQPPITRLPPSGGRQRTATRASSERSMMPCPTTFPSCVASSRTASSTCSGSGKRRTASHSRGIDQNDPAALQEALHLADTHPRVRIPEGYVVPPWAPEPGWGLDV
jgi:hypothetical protein